MNPNLVEPVVDIRPDGASTGPLARAEKSLERRGRAWLIWSFLACPCHLPLTLGFLGVVLGGTALGAMVRDNAVLAGVIITTVWAAGTGRGLWLVRKGERGELACAAPDQGFSPPA